MSTRTRTVTAQDALFVARRVRGDLLSIQEKFNIGTVSEMSDLAHDIEAGLAVDCLSKCRVFLYPPSSETPSHVYVYARTDVDSFEPRSHSGGIVRERALFGGYYRCEVILSDPERWDTLRLSGKLHLRWTSTAGRSVAGMRSTDDGGYASGAFGLSRTLFVR